MIFAPRTAATSLVVTAALVLGACGGGTSGGGSKDTYKASLNRFCGAVSKSQKDVEAQIQKIQSDPGATKDPQAAIKGFGNALGQFATDLNQALDGLKASTPPSDYKAFHDGAVKAIGQLASKVQEAADATKKGDTKALQSFGSEVDSIKVPDVPKDLKNGVKNCDELSSSSAT